MITGTVKDRNSGESLPQASVYFSDSQGNMNSDNAGTAADANGKYSLNRSGPGYITASYTGYEKQTRPCGIMAAATEMINFYLEPAANLLPEVEIKAAAPIWNKVLAGAGIVGAALMLAWYLRKH